MQANIELRVDPELLVSVIERTIAVMLAQQKAIMSFDRQLGEQLLFTEKQAAARLGMTPISLKEERLKGRIQHLNRGRQVKYLPEHLVAYVESWKRNEERP